MGRLRPSTDLDHSTAIRVDDRHPWDLFWALGQNNLPQLVCRLPADTEFPSQNEVPRVRSIDITLTRIHPWCWCVIELQDRAFEDIFQALCKALVEATREIRAQAGVMPVLLRHLGRWQRMLSKKVPPQTLSLQDQIGLTGELLFLLDHIMATTPIQDAISCWVAPQEHPQDFLTSGNKAVEIKCRQATAPEIVHISSQWQLHQDSIPLILVVFTLGRSERNNGFSLYSLVQIIRARLENDIQAQDEFEIALFDRGYVDIQEQYDSRWWTKASTSAYLVEDDFPRLQPANLPPGIIDTNYTIALPECTPWAVELDDIIN